jgi:DNA-binding MarR family transcriptional regulator
MSSDARPTDVLGFLLKHATMVLTERTDAALAPLSIDGKEFGALRVLARREPMSQLQVAQTLGIDRTTMVALLDTLERKGIVARHPDPSDRRRNVVELTEQGEAVVDAAETLRRQVEEEFLAPVGAADGERLRRTLRTLLA